MMSFKYEAIQFEEWNETHFPAYLVERFNSERQYLWFPSSFNYSLQGSRVSPEGQKYIIRISYIPNDECGMTFEEYSKYVRYLDIGFMVSDEYIDPKNIENPIQIAIKDHLHYFIEAHSPVITDMYIRK